MNGKIVCIGDSYLQGYSPDGKVKSWGSFLCETLKKTAGDDFLSFAHGGCGFCMQNGGKTFGTLLAEAADTLADNEELVTAVIVGGGVNDRSYSTGGYLAELKQAVIDFVEDAQAYFPRATVYVAHISTAVSSSVLQKINVPFAYANAATGGAVYLGNIAAILTADKGLFASDKTHPNERGQEALAARLHNALRGGDNTISRPAASVPATGGSFINFVAGNTYHLSTPGRITINNMRPRTVVCNGANALYIFDFTETRGYIPDIPAGSSFEMHGLGGVRDSSGYHNIQFRAVLAGRSVILYPYAINKAGNNFLTLTNADTIHCFGLSFSCDVSLV